MCKKLTTQDFIVKSQEVHGNDRYNYDLVHYIDNSTKVKIKCNECLTIFEQRPASHHEGRGCKICFYNKLTNSNFNTESEKIHGHEKYDYSMVVYINNKTKVDIICKTCTKIFSQKPDLHLNRKSGCPNCSKTRNITTDEFIVKSMNLHGKKYNYDLVKYVNNKLKVDIKCNQCQNIFKQRPDFHMQGGGCFYCQTSKGETYIKKYLDDNQIQYKQQTKFANCINKKPLPFDFYIPSQDFYDITQDTPKNNPLYSILIEFQGIQHYEPTKRFGGEAAFAQRQINDNIKRLFAKSNDFNLIEIPYTLSDEEIVSLLDFHLKK